ncbi:hypothetical protein GE21DRAFT_1027182 [Neurospora crassa]|nr:hypothetical protein GE21DRAFT_1027182 [Neurospora crassa]
MSKGPGVAFRYIHYLVFTSSRSSDISAGFFVTTVIFLSVFFSGVHMAGSARFGRQGRRRGNRMQTVVTGSRLPLAVLDR